MPTLLPPDTFTYLDELFKDLQAKAEPYLEPIRIDPAFIEPLGLAMGTPTAIQKIPAMERLRILKESPLYDSLSQSERLGAFMGQHPQSLTSQHLEDIFKAQAYKNKMLKMRDLFGSKGQLRNFLGKHAAGD